VLRNQSTLRISDHDHVFERAIVTGSTKRRDNASVDLSGTTGP
jgi:hypothetical protein